HKSTWGSLTVSERATPPPPAFVMKDSARIFPFFSETGVAINTVRGETIQGIRSPAISLGAAGPQRRATMQFFRLIGSLALAVFLATAPAAAAEAPPVIATIKAHPALWTVRSAKGTAYLFGSVHLLPPNIDWHSPDVDAA